jgi:hypothetical protein
VFFLKKKALETIAEKIKTHIFFSNIFSKILVIYVMITRNTTAPEGQRTG